jgi:hypothetical protein
MVQLHIALHFLMKIDIMRNRICENHTTLELKLKKQLMYKYCVTIPLEIRCINK